MHDIVKDILAQIDAAALTRRNACLNGSIAMCYSVEFEAREFGEMLPPRFILTVKGGHIGSKNPYVAINYIELDTIELSIEPVTTIKVFVDSIFSVFENAMISDLESYNNQRRTNK